MERHALQLASVASMIDLFNKDNISILQSLDYSVDVAANFVEGSITSQERVDEFKQELESQNISTFHVPIPRSLKRVKDIFVSYKIIKKLVNDNKYQIVHCHSPIGGVICRCACKKARKIYGTKVVYTAHGFHFYKGSSLISWLLYYPVEKWCSKYTDVLITINQEDYQIANRMKAARVEYVHGIGVHTDEIANVKVNRKDIRSKLGFSDEDFVFMSTGQISIRKNHELVIRALAQIDDERIKYLIVGFGEEEERLKRLVDILGLGKRVVFAGYRSDVKELLHAVDGFAFPSLQEGLPVALMEAMAAGLPVVASRIRGNVDLIEDGVGGYLVNLNEVNGFVEAMNRVVNNRTIGSNNLISIKSFDVSNVKHEMEKIYRSLS